MNKTDEKLLQKAIKRHKTLYDAEYENKRSFVDNMKFAFNIDSGQWDADDVADRDQDDNPRPHLSMNKLAKFVAQVVNAEKGQPSMDEVIPVDDKADPEMARIYNELITDIEYQSEADEVYALSGEHAVAGGFGYWRILTEYTDRGFDQEIKIKPIKNPLMVSLDYKGEYGFIREAMTKEEFEEAYPKKEQTDFESMEEWGNNELWYNEDNVYIAEYFQKEPVEKELVEFLNPENGETAVVERTEENADILAKFEIKRSRKVKSHKVMWYKMSGSEILDRGEWPGSEIPIIEVSGHEIHLEGKTYKKSLISDAKDAQRMYNYWLTSLTEKVALSPKAPFIVTEQQIKGHEDDWDDANIKNKPYLVVNTTASGIPARTPASAVDAGAMTLLNLANNDIKDTLGMYESSLGQSSNERSGKAIMARNARSDLGTYSFQDNFRKARAKTKKMIVELLPIIYDNDRVLRLRGSDKQVRINYEEIQDGEVVRMNDLNRGRFDIRMKTIGTPSRRQQTVDNILQGMQYAGPHAPALLPLFFKFLDAPGSEEMAATIMQSIQQQTEQPKN